MSWKQIENSYFWLNYAPKWKTLTIRFLNPLTTKVREFKISFALASYDLLGEDTQDEIACRMVTNARKAKEEKRKKEKQKWDKIYTIAVATAKERIAAESTRN